MQSVPLRRFVTTWRNAVWVWGLWANMSNENIEHLFQQAFGEVDPAPCLLQVVKDHPTCENIQFPPVKYYVEALEENPFRGQAVWDLPFPSKS